MSRKSKKKRKFKYRNTKCRNTKRKYNRKNINKNINIKTKKKMKGGSKTKTSGSINSEYTNLEVAKTKLILARSTNYGNSPLYILPPELIECIADNIKHNYKVGENVILKPIKPYDIQYKNVRIDEIDNEKFIGTINFSNGKMQDNYKFYLYEIMERVIPFER